MEKTKLPYLNRELSWMDFNYRVLEEAFEKENPIMERLRFLAITASNLDEFFMVRVAGVKAQVNSGYRIADPSGLTPDQLLALQRKYALLWISSIPTFTVLSCPCSAETDLRF